MGAPGAGKRLQFPIEHYHHVGGANHFDLLNHPAIYAQIRRCVQSQRALPRPRRLADADRTSAQRP